MSGPFGSSALNFSSAGDYEILNSLSFDGASSPKLTMTPGAAGDRRKWTWSCWTKITQPLNGGNAIGLFGQNTNNSATANIQIDGTSGEFHFENYTGAYQVLQVSERKLLDHGNWYHLMVVLDTAQGTAANRVKMYVNGDQVTTKTGGSHALPDQNAELRISNNTEHQVGQVNGSYHYDGQMAEMYFLDGLALTPASFGVADATYGNWKPIQYTGAAGGDESFYLNFSVAGAGTSACGKDFSGNNNNFASANLSAHDRKLDSPSNNFCCLEAHTNFLATLSEGGTRLTSKDGIGGQGGVAGTMSLPTSGKWYWEVHAKDLDNDRPNHYYGIDQIEQLDHRDKNTVGSGKSAFSRVYQSNGNGVVNNDNESGYGAAWSDGNIIAVALDMDNGTLKFYRNNSVESSGNAAFTGLSVYRFVPSFAVYEDAASADTGNSFIVNFGQDSSFSGTKTAQGKQDENGIGDFYYTPPTGYVALCSKNLPEPAVVPKDTFGTNLWTGNGGTQNIGGLNFKPDMIWGFTRSHDSNVVCFDSVRGVGKTVQLDLGEVQEDQNGVTAFRDDGFALGSWGGFNANTKTFLAHNWHIPTAFSNDASSTSIGSQDSTGRVNVDAGLSIFTYTGSADADTMKHGLAKAPTFYTTKPLTDVSDNQWFVSSYAFANSDWETDFAHFDNNAAIQDSGARWNDTKPTSSVLSVGPVSTNTNSGSYLCYAWHDVDGFSRIGYYLGNGNADGPLVLCGFQPAWVMCKKISADHNWVIVNNATEPTNDGTNSFLNLDDTSAEDTDPGILLLSDGFKVNDTAARYNTDGSRYMFFAFAQLPGKYGNAR